LGARNVGMDQVYFNPTQLPQVQLSTYTIRELNELMGIL